MWTLTRQADLPPLHLGAGSGAQQSNSPVEKATRLQPFPREVSLKVWWWQCQEGHCLCSAPRFHLGLCQGAPEGRIQHQNFILQSASSHRRANMAMEVMRWLSFPPKPLKVLQGWGSARSCGKKAAGGCTQELRFQ